MGTSPCAITLNADTAVTATFPVTPPPAILTISPSGTGTGTVTCSVNGGAFGACAPSYPNATPLVLQGVADNGSFFAGWSNGTGNATACTNTAVNCSLTLTANSSVSDVFNLIVPLSVTGISGSSQGGQGTVQCSANGSVVGPCTNYLPGTQISMTASPNNASIFTAWNSASGSATACNASTNTVCTFTLTITTSITANFKRPTLTVVVAGTGTVSSNPGGITNCTTNCSGDFNKGDFITLTATGTGFTGWSGGVCSGIGPCGVTLNADTMVTASFSQMTSSAEGLWTGSLNNGRSLSGLVLDDGTGWFLYSVAGNPSVIAGLVQGNGSSQNGSFTLSNGMDFNLEGNGINSVSITGTYVMKQSLNGTVTYQNQNFGQTTFTSTYNADYDLTPNANLLVGTYTGSATTAGGPELTTVTLSAPGSITGANNSGCNFTGSFSPRTHGNAYDVSVTFAGGVCSHGTSTVTGIGFFNAATKTLYSAGVNNTRTNGFIFVGTKP